MADGTRITTTTSRPSLGNSPQARWQRRQQERGNCRACGEPRPPELKQLCRDCQTKVNSYMKRYRASKRDGSIDEVALDADGNISEVVTTPRSK